MSLLEKYYDYILNDVPASKSEEIVFEIMKDFTDRRGLRQEWDNIDDDIQEEIIETWINKIEDKI